MNEFFLYLTFWKYSTTACIVNEAEKNKNISWKDKNKQQTEIEETYYAELWSSFHYASIKTY